MDGWARLYALAKAQADLVAVWQAERSGISRRMLSRRVHDDGWQRILTGVYLLPGCQLTAQGRVTAAVLALQRPDPTDGAPVTLALSHHAAAFCWGLMPAVRWPVDMVVFGGRHPRRKLVSVHRLRGLDPAVDVTLRRSLPVLRVEHTLRTLAPVATLAELRRLIAVADRKRLTTRGRIGESAASFGAFAGCEKFWKALGEPVLTHSELEALGRRALMAAGFVPHPRPFTVVHDGVFVAEVDIAFIEERVAVEIDGPHHRDPAQRRADEDRRQRLEALGWRVVRADEARLVYESRLFVQQVRAALRAQRS